jgi:glucoamylase
MVITTQPSSFATTRIFLNRISSAGRSRRRGLCYRELSATTSALIPQISADCTDEDPNCGTLLLANQPPGVRSEFPAKEIVDAGFLELVRFGIRGADDPVIKDSLRVVDTLLKVETPYGPSWRRYNHDGYGQREDGGSHIGWGIGRPWPLLTGERGHYGIAAGRDSGPYLRALENFSQGIGLIPEQIWDGPDLAARHQ